ncbi:MAG: ornithine carbamoyltransferase [Candidatus Caenarcaniphilales bacterium]|nr:ornithine carbamoyltransferase [Candidatus Caenarcaniphilales bacterium]
MKKFPKDLISIADFDKEQILDVLDLAAKLKAERKTHEKSLLNQTVGVLTSKPSLRTRLSFEVAIIELGGNSLFIKNEEVGLGMREEAEDIAKVVSRYLSSMVVRAHEHKHVVDLAKHASIPVINALTDLEHPCQILADLLTIKENFGKFEKIKLGYVGDGNNVTNSLMLASAICGLEFYAITPPGHEPSKKYVDWSSELAKRYSAPAPTVTNDVDEISKMDILYTDVWVSMGDDTPKEKIQDVFQPYQLSKENLKNKNIPVLHCLPAHKEEEISKEVFDANSELIFSQAENRLHAQKSVLIKLLR